MRKSSEFCPLRSQVGVYGLDPQRWPCALGFQFDGFRGTGWSVYQRSFGQSPHRHPSDRSAALSLLWHSYKAMNSIVSCHAPSSVHHHGAKACPLPPNLGTTALWPYLMPYASPLTGRPPQAPSRSQVRPVPPCNSTRPVRPSPFPPVLIPARGRIRQGDADPLGTARAHACSPDPSTLAAPLHADPSAIPSVPPVRYTLTPS
jgi:hypothetical protein